MKKKANYILLVTSILITLLFVEIGFRIGAYIRDMNTLENLEQTLNVPKPGKRVNLGHIIRMSKNPRIIYKLIPNLSVIFKNQPITVNANGFRGDIIPIAKNPQSIRIVGIGDSIMFGWGVKDEETYLAVLSRMLNLRCPEYSWEIINTAVPGYNTVQEVETLKEEGIPYKPDIVLIDYVGNDLSLPNFIREQEDYFALNQSFMVKYFRGKLGKVKMISTPMISKGRARVFESNPQKVPKQYKNMVGLEAYHGAMKELQVLSRKNKFDVIVFSYAKLPAFVKEISSQLGFYVLETAHLFKKYASEQNLNAETVWWQISKEDPHPSAIIHKIIAEALFKFIEEIKHEKERARGLEKVP